MATATTISTTARARATPRRATRGAPRRATRVVARARDDDDARDAGADATDDAGARRTAVVAGVVSVALAVGYLALVQVMDSREMVAPPPEAYGDGSVRPADEEARRGATAK